MEQDGKQDDLKRFYTFGLTLLQFMGVLALVGIVLGVTCWYFFK